MFAITHLHLVLIFITLISTISGTTNTDTKITDVPLEKWVSQIEEWNKTVGKLPDFIINNAWLTLKSTLNEDLKYYLQHDQCYKCLLVEEAVVSKHGNRSALIQSDYGNYIDMRRYDDTSEEVVCSDRKAFQEKGEYWLIIYEDTTDGILCDMVLVNNPPNLELAILWAFLFLLGLAALWILFKILYAKGVFRKCLCKSKSYGLDAVFEGSSKTTLELEEKNENGTPNTEAEPQPAATNQKAKTRLSSLDAFRGLTIMTMIFVNSKGGSYWFFQHAFWNGLLVADIVFPWFVFIMGTSIAFSIRGMQKKGFSTPKILYMICKRTTLMFAIGLCIDARNYKDLSRFRLPGILQRLGLAYLITALTHFLCPRMVTRTDKWWSSLRDLLDYWAECIVMLCIVALHCGLVFGLPVPGCPTGYLGPGGLHDGSKYFNCTGGATGYIDRMLFTEDHMMRSPSSSKIYKQSVAFDAEGLMGSVMAIFNCFLGLQAGKIIITYEGNKSRILRWIIWGTACVVLGLILCNGTREDGWIPINKNLWSLTYVLVASSMAYIVLSLMYLAIDWFPVWSGAPLIYPGMNAITIYVCHSVFSGYFPLAWQVSDENEHWQLLYQDIWGVCLLTLLSYHLYRTKTFIAL